MTKSRYQLPLLMFLFLATVQGLYAANSPRLRINKIGIRTDSNSAGHHIKKITISTQQSRVEMWGTLTLYVQVKDKAEEIYFGSASFKQPRRSGGTTSNDEWVFHVLIEKLDNPKITGIWAVYENNADKKNFGEKKKFVKTKKLNDWVKSNVKAKELTVRGESHSL